MAALLKHSFDARVVRSLAADLARAWPPFDARGFVRASLRGLEALELTPRGAHVASAVHSTRRPNPGRHTLEARVNGAAFPLGTIDVVRRARVPIAPAPTAKRTSTQGRPRSRSVTRPR